MNGHLLLAVGVVCVCLGQVMVVAAEVDVGEKTLIDAPISVTVIDDVKRSIQKSCGHGRFSDRRKRQTGCGSTLATITEVQKIEIVEAHNNFRGQEQSMNELIMEWDDGLASLAQSWVNTCQWAHGMLTDCDGVRVGQNLFLATGSLGFPFLNFTQAITSWYGERSYWDFTTQSCLTGKVCGHWTQVVAAKSGKVGCAFATCPTISVSGGTWTNALIIGCDYSPAGNVAGESIFMSGTPCTACTTVTGSLTYRGYKCQKNLCVPCIPLNDPTCQCGPALTCLNGGSYSYDTCVCQCAAGFYGNQCENSCTCSDLYGATCLSWINYCTDPLYKTFMKANCGKTCNLCDTPASCLV